MKIKKNQMNNRKIQKHKRDEEEHIHTGHPHSEENTGRSNDGAPLLSPWKWFHPTTQDGRGTVRPRHNPDSSRGSTSEDQTYRWLPVTHHHYISAQYHHIPEVRLSRGNRRSMGEEGGRDSTLCNTATAWETERPALSQVFGSTTHLQPPHQPGC